MTRALVVLLCLFSSLTARAGEVYPRRPGSEIVVAGAMDVRRMAPRIIYPRSSVGFEASPEAGSGKGVYPPWHMWGSSSTMNIDLATGAGNKSAQLATVDYGRPDNWQFFFSCKILGLVGAGPTSNVVCCFDIIVGVGRESVVFGPSNSPSATALGGFAQITIGPTGFMSATPGLNAFMTQVPAGTVAQGGGALQPISAFPAQSIRAQCRLASSTGNFPNGSGILQLDVAAAFSPSTHVRPEWYQGIFQGGEDRGH